MGENNAPRFSQNPVAWIYPILPLSLGSLTKNNLYTFYGLFCKSIKLAATTE